VVALSTGDVTSGLVRPLAAEIDKPPLVTNEKSRITCERCAINRKFVLNTNRKPLSGYSLKIFSPLGGASFAAEPRKRK
jgi:hypothetical protein